MEKERVVESETLARLRDDAVEIFLSALRAVDPNAVVRSKVRIVGERLTVDDHTYALDQFERIYIVGAGKASAAMAQALESLLDNRIRGGVVNVKTGHTVPLSTVELVEASHPVPDEAGLEGTHRIVDLVSSASGKDLILCLISGGGSALLPSPGPGLNLEDKQRTTRLLLRCGATIQEINAIRKHISGVKGGRLARLAYPATMISLILSDVIGDDLDSIASGPTVPDPSTFADCMEIVRKYGIFKDLPEPVRTLLDLGVQGGVAETPKPGDPVFARTQNAIIGNNLLAVSTAEDRARELGYHPLVLSSRIEGETRDVAMVHSAIAKEIRKSGRPLASPACVISGGETTVTIKGSGVGGRNQEFALAAALEIEGWTDIVILSGGTDGTDGPTEAAGAIADGTTVQKAREIGLEAKEYLRNNDSYNFFKPIRGLLITGPTLTNVMDLRLVLVR